MGTRIIICGAGPTGLALACGLAPTGIDIVVVEKQPLDLLSSPPFDGREIALTHRSIAALERLGAWQHIPRSEIFPLRQAHVLDGKSPLALAIEPGGDKDEALGALVTNQLIRRALFEAATRNRNIRILDGRSIENVATDAQAARVTLDNDSEEHAALLVAADSRFSSIRGKLSISARMNRLGKSMLVGRVAIETDHGHVATEWFDHGQTLALLPLGPGEASAVVTLGDGEAADLAAADPETQGRDLTRRFQGRFGRMKMRSALHCYPLTTSWSCHFAATRAALVGDAAVGMHPVTAHGFNLGLAGTERLSSLVGGAIKRGGDPGSALLLRRFEVGHRAATWPLYRATNAIVDLYTRDTPLARVARKTALGLARAKPARRMVARLLMQKDGAPV